MGSPTRRSVRLSLSRWRLVRDCGHGRQRGELAMTILIILLLSSFNEKVLDALAWKTFQLEKYIFLISQVTTEVFTGRKQPLHFNKCFICPKSDNYISCLKLKCDLNRREYQYNYVIFHINLVICKCSLYIFLIIIVFPVINSHQSADVTLVGLGLTLQRASVIDFSAVVYGDTFDILVTSQRPSTLRWDTYSMAFSR